MKKQITIGIPGFLNDGKTHFGVGINHIEFVRFFGFPRIITQYDEPANIMKEIDMLYLPGGMDLNPASYGQIPTFKCGHTDVFKQFFFDKRLPEYISANFPIFGVCLGMQQLAAYFGSILTQNLPHHEQSRDRWLEAHYIYQYLPEKNNIRVLDGKKNLQVNSHHHQGVLVKDLGEDLLPLWLAVNEEQPMANIPNMIVEAFKHKTRPIIGVQWHPEELPILGGIATDLINSILHQ